MNLQSQVSEELWGAVRSSYEAEHYSHAIKDAMAAVTEALRDKSGLDGDGRSLVIAALGPGKGGSPPKIQVNKLETQTELDIQYGLREVIGGMYMLVRNPRTHERLEDDKQTADAIIYFINYLLNYLGESRAAFTIEDFVKKVVDPHFVKNSEYVAALVDSVPIRKRADAMIALFRAADWGNASNFELIIKALLRGASDAEVDHLLSVVSSYLQGVMEGGEVSLVRKLLPAELWPRLVITARLRAEQILIKELKNAWYDPDTDKTFGSAATWLSGIMPYVTLRSELRSTIIELLRSDNQIHPNFVATYLMRDLPKIFQESAEIFVCTRAIAASIGNDNKYVEEELVRHVSDYPDKWFKHLGSALEHVTDPLAPAVSLPDGTPLLKSRAVEAEDDIPF